MKKLKIPIIILFLIFTVSITAAKEFPEYTGYVNDLANVIPDNYEVQIEILAQELEQKTTVEMAVVTMPDLGEEYYVDYAVELAEHWGIGKEGKDNGVLILDAIKERRVRIEVGYGLEGILPDGFCGEILDKYAVPYLRNDDYGRGLLGAARAVASVIAKDQGVTLTGQINVTRNTSTSTRSKGGWAGCCPIIIIIILIIVTRGRIIPWLLLGSLTRGFGGGFSGGGSGFSGGFGGFGGGSFGGGGAGRGY